MNMRELVEAVEKLTNTPALSEKIQNLIILAYTSLKSGNVFTNDVDVVEFSASPTYDTNTGMYVSYIPSSYYGSSDRVAKVELYATTCKLLEVGCYSSHNEYNFTKGYSQRGMELKSKAKFSSVKLYKKPSQSGVIDENDWIFSKYSAYFIHYAAYYIYLEFGQNAEATAHYRDMQQIRYSMLKDVFK